MEVEEIDIRLENKFFDIKDDYEIYVKVYEQFPDIIRNKEYSIIRKRLEE
jgi:hypothetical protein